MLGRDKQQRNEEGRRREKRRGKRKRIKKREDPLRSKQREAEGANLEEAADVDSVVRVHEDHVLKQPEEGPGVFLFGLQQLKDAVELKEQPASALCPTEEGIAAKKTIFILVSNTNTHNLESWTM